MPWVKLDDAFDEHDKIVEAGPLGMALDVAGLCYSNRNLTDGHVPRAQVPRLISTVGLYDEDGQPIDPRSVASTLVELDVWHEPGHSCPSCPQPDRGYVIHDYHDFQPSREKVEEDRKAARDRMRRVRANNSRTSSEHDANTERTSGEVPAKFGDRSPDVPGTGTKGSAKNPVPGTSREVRPNTNGRRGDVPRPEPCSECCADRRHLPGCSRAEVTS